MSEKPDNTPIWMHIWQEIKGRWPYDEFWLAMCMEAEACGFERSMVEVDMDYATEIADVVLEVMDYVNTDPSMFRRIMLARNIARATGAPVDHLVAIAERGGRVNK